MELTQRQNAVFNLSMGTRIRFPLSLRGGIALAVWFRSPKPEWKPSGGDDSIGIAGIAPVIGDRSLGALEEYGRLRAVLKRRVRVEGAIPVAETGVGGVFIVDTGGGRERPPPFGLPGSAVQRMDMCTPMPASRRVAPVLNQSPAGRLPSRPSTPVAALSGTATVPTVTPMRMKTPAITTLRYGCTGDGLDCNAIAV